MIAVDTSALMSVLIGEAAGKRAGEILQSAGPLCISAGTVAEALIVARRRGIGLEMASLIDGLGAEIVPLTRAFADIVADAYDRWGKGQHEAGLNFGDCFAYALAATKECPLLYVGDDFSKTDVVAAV